MMQSYCRARLLLPGNQKQGRGLPRRNSLLYTCTPWNLLPPLPVDFVLCITTLHLAFDNRFCETHAISWALPSSHTNFLLLFLCLRSGTTSALTEWSLSYFLLHGSPLSPVCGKPYVSYFITFPHYSSAKFILSLIATAQASSRLDYGLKHMYVFLKNIQLSCLCVLLMYINSIM